MSLNKNKPVKNTKSNTKSNKSSETTNPYYFYNHDFLDTKLIPSTKITDYMRSNFSDFRSKYDKLNKEFGHHELNDPKKYFNFDKMKRTGERQFEFDKPIERNPNTTLDELIAHSFFVNSPEIFRTDALTYLSNLKFQMGKDIRRADKRKINGITYHASYSEQYFSGINHYQVTDIFYKLLISFFQTNGGIINYDEINKFALLSCQNMFNFIGSIIIMHVRNIISPEDNAQLGQKRSENIIIKPNSKTMTLNFETQLMISKDKERGEFMDPEYPCGHLEYSLLLDLTNNTYEFTKFKLDYNLDDCGPPPLDATDTDSSISINGDTKSDSPIDLKYAIPVALGVGTIVALPLILGGKTKTRKRKSLKIKIIKTKTRKHKKIRKTNKKSTIKEK